ncbi:MAG: hypothetical protein K0U93_06990 [Gammaproteobacteria bacterium]|nr:hypothetical protein [Gammaproteobacteria bacterium]
MKSIVLSGIRWVLHGPDYHALRVEVVFGNEWERPYLRDTLRRHQSRV